MQRPKTRASPRGKVSGQDWRKGILPSQSLHDVLLAYADLPKLTPAQKKLRALVSKGVRSRKQISPTEQFRRNSELTLARYGLGRGRRREVLPSELARRRGMELQRVQEVCERTLRRAFDELIKNPTHKRTLFKHLE